MIEQRAVLDLLNDDPITESVPWIVGEPSVQDIMRDPLVHAVLRRDGLSSQDLMRAISRGRHRLSPVAGSLPAAGVSEVPASDPARDAAASGAA